MPMQMGFRWYGEGNDKIKLSDIRQIPGVSTIVLGAVAAHAEGAVADAAGDADELDIGIGAGAVNLGLRSSSDSIRSICHRLGFESQSYFAAEFRKVVDMTPTEYRQRNGIA